MGEALIEARDLVRTFGGGRTLLGAARPAVHAVRGVSLDVRAGETHGVVGESGCGKSTVARMLVGLDAPTTGEIVYEGEDLGALARRDRRALARRIQYVFQDPISSLNPRKTVRHILAAPLRHLRGMTGSAARERMSELMDAVNLRPEFIERYPHEFSGGQAQRIGIARALAAEPDVLVLDEPVSALDVSIQAQVLHLLDDLKQRFGLTYVFISHDLAVVETISDRVSVMYFGRIVEQAEARELFETPRHPYAQLLFDSAPVPGKRGLKGEERAVELPDPLAPPPGCSFAPRCPRVLDRCREELPDLQTDIRPHPSACFNPVPMPDGEAAR